MGRVQKNFEGHDRESPNCLEQIDNRNLDIKNVINGKSKESKKHVLDIEKEVFLSDSDRKLSTIVF